MKKILIPTLLTTTLTPLISLVGCKNSEHNLDSYLVTSEEMIKAVALTGIDFIQLHRHNVYVDNGEEYPYEIFEYSPTSYHRIRSDDPINNLWTYSTRYSYSEEYIVKNPLKDNYLHYTRHDKAEDFDDPEEVGEEYFIAIDELRTELVEKFATLMGYCEGFVYDEQNKCYNFDAQLPSVHCFVSYYFYEKKLIKMEEKIEVLDKQSEGEIHEHITDFAYDEITPQPTLTPK